MRLLPNIKHMRKILIGILFLGLFMNDALAQKEVRGRSEGRSEGRSNPDRVNQGGRDRPDMATPTPPSIPTPAPPAPAPVPPPVVQPTLPNIEDMPLQASQVTLDALKKLEDLQKLTSTIAGMMSFNMALEALKTKNGKVGEFAKNVNDMNPTEIGNGLKSLRDFNVAIVEATAKEMYVYFATASKDKMTPEEKIQHQVEFEFWNKLNNVVW